VRWRAIFESVQHAGEAMLDFLAAVACNAERLVHDVRLVVADRPRAELDAVADDVVLPRLDGQWILGLQRLEPALRHGKGVVAEVDLLRRLVVLEHWKVDDPAERELAFGDQPHLLGDLGSRLAGELPGRRLLIGNEEYRVAVLRAGQLL